LLSLEDYKRVEVLLKHKNGLEVKICLKVFRRRMVPEGEKGSRVKAAVEILERGKERTDKTALEDISTRFIKSRT
jgi:hypothetical protein